MSDVHTGGGQWPGGYRVSYDEVTKKYDSNMAEYRAKSTDTTALYISSAAIIRWRPITEWLTTMLQPLDYNRSIADIISHYLPSSSFATWYPSSSLRTDKKR
jgi:hypothetical protein